MALQRVQNTGTGELARIILTNTDQLKPMSNLMVEAPFVREQLVSGHSKLQAPSHVTEQPERTQAGTSRKKNRMLDEAAHGVTFSNTMTQHELTTVYRLLHSVPRFPDVSKNLVPNSICGDQKATFATPQAVDKEWDRPLEPSEVVFIQRTDMTAIFYGDAFQQDFGWTAGSA